MFSLFSTWNWDIPKKGANCNDQRALIQGLFTPKFNFFILESMDNGVELNIHGSASLIIDS
jgi:hypothetical protein